jgi:hypothetical protein
MSERTAQQRSSAGNTACLRARTPPRDPLLPMLPDRSHPSASILLLLLVLTLAPAAASGAQARQHDDRALAPLAEAIAAWSSARAEDAGVEAAEARVAQSLDALAGDEPGADVLRRAGDLARAAWLARGYAAADVRPGKVTTAALERGSFAGAPLEYAYRLPKDYDTKRTAYPLILALPDADEPPAQHLRTHWIHGDLLERAILVAPELPADPAEWERVSVRGRPGGLTRVLTTLAHALATFAADPDRVYVVGRGRSVPTALAAGNHAPQRFAGVVGRAGDAGELGPQNFTNVPTLFTGGGERAIAFGEGLRARGIENSSIDANDDEAAVWRWMQAHARAPAPAALELKTGEPFPTRVHWLRVAPRRRARARARRSSGRPTRSASTRSACRR